MKILLINTVPTRNNGITGVIFNYLKAINPEGITLDLVSLNEPAKKYADIVASKGGKVYVMSRLDGVLAYWRNLYRLIRNNRYDAVHIHGNSHTVVLELSAAKLAGCVVRMVHSHNTTCKHVVVSKLLTIPFRMLYTHGLACGVAAGRWMFGHGKFTVINNGVDTRLYGFNEVQRSLIRNERGWAGCKVVGHVGGFVETKNHSFILDVFRELFKRDNTYRLMLIGEGALRSDIERKIRELNLSDAVCMTGNIDNVYDYLNAMDIVLMPSLFEGLPLTLVEQQANGLRCVVSDTITKEVDKTGNIVFCPLALDVAKWAENIASQTPDSDEQRKERSLRAMEDIRKCGYSIQEEANKLKDYYTEAIGR